MAKTNTVPKSKVCSKNSTSETYNRRDYFASPDGYFKYLELLESLKNPYDMNEWSIEDEVAKIKASMPVSSETDESRSMQVTSSMNSPHYHLNQIIT